eukprot:GFUD01114246.1.p1 GENE.GFUD01114246.1~~GFUD01114246.1.p1  ORF type:complete len:372 (-),score=94.49 GFUD01114246.1:640-1755(-)
MKLASLFLLSVYLSLSDQIGDIKNLNLVSSISPTQSVEEGSSVELECRLGNVPDRAEVAWVRIRGVEEVDYLSIYDKEDGQIDYEEEQATSEMSEEEEGWVWRLILSKVTTSLAGLYQCQVLIHDEVVSSRKVLLNVLDPNKVEHNTKYVITKQGRNITLDCTDFEGEDVNWKRLGDCLHHSAPNPISDRAMNETTVVQNGKRLSLIRVDRSDSGIYVCSVYGGSKTMNVSLLVQHIPTINPSKSIMSQFPGYPSSLSCEVTAVPVPAVSWYSLSSPLGPSLIKSHGDLSITIDDYKDGRMTSSLVFYNVTQEDYGHYSCNATNILGQASATAKLVFSPIPVLTESGSATRHEQMYKIVMTFLVMITMQFD